MDDLRARIVNEIPALRRYALCLLRDHDRADDLVQDCLERALSRLHLWRRPGNLRSWLFTILHNLHANHRRALHRRPQLLDLETHDDQGYRADQLEQVEVREVMAAFHRLDANQREALVLVVVEGLRYAEAARILGVPEGTVVSRVARARARLRALVGEPAPYLRRVK